MKTKMRQEEREEAMPEAVRKTEEKEGRIIKGIGGFYYVYAEDGGLYECRARGVFRSRRMKPMVGDRGVIAVISEEEKTGNLVEILPRKNQLVRPMSANVDQALVIFSAHEPEPNFNLLNRFLIAMAQQELPVILCFNKMDLASEEERQALAADYRGSGCRLVFSSMQKGEGADELKDLLLGKTTVLAGPSGVGKSSTVNALGGFLQMETGKVSEKIRRGKHTTRHAELLRIARDTYLMDTPGFSSLYLNELEKEDLRFYFPEFAPYENTCRFHGCTHVHEPDCRVKEAVEAGEISRLRYEDYCLIFRELEQKKKW